MEAPECFRWNPIKFDICMYLCVYLCVCSGQLQFFSHVSVYVCVCKHNASYKCDLLHWVGICGVCLLFVGLLLFFFTSVFVFRNMCTVSCTHFQHALKIYPEIKWVSNGSLNFWWVYAARTCGCDMIFRFNAISMI